jgi:hypothetical protein
MSLSFFTYDSKIAGITKATAIKPLPPGGSETAANIQFPGSVIELAQGRHVILNQTQLN